MTVQLPISTHSEQLLRRMAAEAGLSVEAYMTRRLELWLAAQDVVTRVSGPVLGEFLRSGMSDDELGEFLESAKHSLRRGEVDAP